MKQIQGTSYNIEDDIVGRITFGKGNLFGRSNNILVCNDTNKPAFGYLATSTECATFHMITHYCSCKNNHFSSICNKPSYISS